MHTIRIRTSREKTLGRRHFNIPFRLKKNCNPNKTFAVVDQELWLLYIYSPLAVQRLVTQVTLLDVMSIRIKVNKNMSALCLF